jgi:hypothetical protein
MDPSYTLVAVLASSILTSLVQVAHSTPASRNVSSGSGPTVAELAELRARASKGESQAQEELVQILEAKDVYLDPQTGLSRANYAPETLRWKKELARDERADVSRETKSKHQSGLAWYFYLISAPIYETTGEHCKAAIDYAKSAIANGDKCAGRLLGQIYRLGRCATKDEREARMWTVITIGCPTY